MESSKRHPGALDVIASVHGRDDGKIARSNMYGVSGSERH